MPYPDALGVVEELERRGVPTGVVSNAGFDIRTILRHHGFTGLADRTTVSYEVGVMKPDPKIFQAALEMLGTSAEETLMVGDNAEADGGATAVGMEFLLLPMSPPGETPGTRRSAYAASTGAGGGGGGGAELTGSAVATNSGSSTSAAGTAG